MAELALTYLGGCPGHDRHEPVQVSVFDDRFELRARGWGWRIGFGSISRLGELQPSADGVGQMVPVVWSGGNGDALRTLVLSGRDAGRLRFLLAQAMIVARHEAEQPRPPVVAPPLRVVGPWQRELRRMRSITAIAMTVALGALVLVFGVTLVVVGQSARRGHWARDRVLVSERSADIQQAQDRGDEGGLSQALKALQDECRRLGTYNGDRSNSGDDFTEVQRVCDTVGVQLY